MTLTIMMLLWKSLMLTRHQLFVCELMHMLACSMHTLRSYVTSSALILYLTKVALESAINRLRLAAQYGGSVIFRHSQGVAAVHPVVLRTVRVDSATACRSPTRTLLHVYIECRLSENHQRVFFVQLLSSYLNLDDGICHSCRSQL